MVVLVTLGSVVINSCINIVMNNVSVVDAQVVHDATNHDDFRHLICSVHVKKFQSSETAFEQGERPFHNTTHRCKLGVIFLLSSREAPCVLERHHEVF